MKEKIFTLEFDWLPVITGDNFCPKLPLLAHKPYIAGEGKDYGRSEVQSLML